MSNLSTIMYFSNQRLHPSFARQNRMLILTVAASVTMHVLAIALLPGARKLHEPVQRALDVILARPAVPQPVEQEPPRPKPIERTRELPKPQKHTLREEPARKTVAVPEPEPKPVLTLPDPGPAAPSTFSVPQAVVEPAAPAVERKPAAAPAAPAPRESIATIPPNFNAAYLRNEVRYPLIARRNGVEGTVRLKVLVTREGRAAHVQLEQSSGSAALDSAALEAVRNWQFAPARRGQDAVESWVLVPVVFKLENTG
ncbi:MAG: TonB family protein [Burkholderiales bacterium]